MRYYVVPVAKVIPVSGTGGKVIACAGRNDIAGTGKAERQTQLRLVRTHS